MLDSKLKEKVKLDEELGFSQPLATQDAVAYINAFAGQRRSEDYALLQKRAGRIGELLGESGYYRFRMGKDMAEGVSVEGAKALALEWGFCWFGLRINQIEGKRIYLTGICIDYISGVVVQRDFVWSMRAPKGRFDKDDDERARHEAYQVQSAGGRAIRNAILDCLPAWFTEPALEGSKRAARTGALKEGQTVESVLPDILKAFASEGIKQAELETYIGVPAVQWSVQSVVDLRALWRGHRDGDLVLKDVFKIEVQESPKADPTPAPAPERSASERARRALEEEEVED